MRRVIYSMGVSLDGYTCGPDGEIDWSAPDVELFRSSIDEVRGVGVHLMGRRLYETMRYWETPDDSWTADEHEWAALWNPLPKVVFSTTLTGVDGDAAARLATGSVADEIARLRAEPGDGDIAIGGATLAAQADALGLVDEYRIRVHPVLIGAGRPYFAPTERRVRLDLVESRTFGSGVVSLRYHVNR